MNALVIGSVIQHAAAAAPFAPLLASPGLHPQVSLLNANDVVRSAMLQNKIINLLLAMLASQIQNVQVGARPRP